MHNTLKKGAHNKQQGILIEKIILLDRDGVINKKPPKGEYVTKVNEFEFLPKTIEALKFLSEKNYTIFIITNQARNAAGCRTILMESNGNLLKTVQSQL
jgi:histidinol phosphatase-like enzyme